MTSACRNKVTFGIGPLIAVPTNTSTNFGPNSLQGGVGGVIITPQSWGLLGVLVTYQHTLWGAEALELTTVQPNVFYNLDHGYYLRSSAIMQFNTYSHTDDYHFQIRGRQGHQAGWQIPA